MKPDRVLHVAFAPWMVAGVRTQWENMQPYIAQRPDIQPYVFEVHPYRRDGAVERLPLVPSKVKGNVRALLSSAALFRPRRLDAAWIPDIRSALPYLLTKGLLQGAVTVSSTDATGMQQADFGDYYASSSNDSLLGRTRNALGHFCEQRPTILAPWSQWAARSLVNDYHIPPERVEVLPPGIDLNRWPLLQRQRTTEDTVHLLFVGGDFARKGGSLLLDVFRHRFKGCCELHLVTREAVPQEPGVHVYHGFEPNDPGLRTLYAYCDIFVLPTWADCFSLASLEAMATGLPVVTTSVGGIPEIVADGHSGYLIAPGDGVALTQRIDALVQERESRMRMGYEGRRIVEDRFDAARNTARLLDTLAVTCHTRDAARVRRAR